MSRTREQDNERQAQVSASSTLISETLIERVVDLAPDAVLLVDADGHIELVNQQAEALFGYTRQELLGMAVEQLIPASLRERHVDHRVRYSHEPHTRPMGSGLELAALRKDGSTFAVEISLSPMTVEGNLHVIGAIRDVTVQRNLERRTRESLEALVAMAEAMARLPTELVPAHEGSSPAAETVGVRLVELTRRMLECHAVSLARLDAHTGVLHPVAIVGMDAEAERRWRQKTLGQKLEDWLRDPKLAERLHGGELVVVDATEQTAVHGLVPGERERLFVPMRMGERLVGILSASCDREEQHAPATQRALASAVGKLGALVIEWDAVLAERRAHAEAETRLALLQAVIDELPSGVYIVQGPDARLVLANSAAEAVWGASWHPGLPMRTFLETANVSISTPDGHPLGEAELGTVQTVRTGNAIRHREEIIRRPDGTAQPILFNAVAMDSGIFPLPRGASGALPQTGEGAMRGALVVLQDVSALKQAERLKDEFIAIAAHELRTPMAAIRGYATMLLRQNRREERGTGHLKSPATGESGAPDELREIEREALEAIDQATSRLAELTDDLLDVARMQAGRLDLRREPQDLVALVHRVIKRTQIASPRHPIELCEAPETLVVDLDVHRFEQVLGNLLSNAIKYSPDGGAIDLRVREICDAEGRPRALLSVSDRGIGIPTAQQSSIFGRFSRATNALERGITGTGLGLYLSRELVEYHDGRIWFESAEGSGTTFFVSLPVYPENGVGDTRVADGRTPE